MILINLSFAFYVKGHKYAVYYPVFVIAFLYISNFSFFPEIYYTKINGGSSIFINYKTQCVMVCNYDNSKVTDIYKLKEEFGVTKVVSNVESCITVVLRGYIKLKVYPSRLPGDFNDIEVFKGNKVYFIDSRSVDKNSDLYVIILNRLFHLTDVIFMGVVL